MLALGQAAPGPAQAAAPPRTLRFDQLAMEEGLAQESVLAVAQDQQGFMWFGSQAGLSRYDGARIVTFRRVAADPASLVDNWVRVLHVDGAGRMWVGTDGGLDRYEPLTQSFTHFPPNEPVKRGNGNRHVRAIVDDGKGGLWIGTSDGLQHFDPATGRYRFWHHDAALPASLGNDQVNALARDADGRLWVGTATGLDMLEPGAQGFRHFRVEAAPDTRFEAVMSLYADQQRTLWVGTMGGIEQWQLAPGARGAAPSRRRIGEREGLRPGVVTTIYQDGEGIVWAGTQTEGLFRWRPDDQRFVQYRHQVTDPHSVADNYVSSLFRDRLGTLWVGTWYNGVSRVDLGSGGFARLVHDAERPASLSDNKVRAIVDAGGGKLWLGNNDGLTLYDPVAGEGQVFRDSGPGFADARDPQVMALWRERGPGGALWVGGRNGVRRFDPATRRFKRVSAWAGDPDGDNVRNIAGDRDGVLWIATRGGLHRYDPRTGAARTYRHDPSDSNSLADNVVRPILEDSRGALWVGTFNGLDLLDRGTGHFRHFRHDPADPASLSHDEVHYLYEDRQGVVWVGTAGGLNRMEIGADGGVRFRRYQRRDGLADDAIAGILDDERGHLWLSTNTGISRLSAQTGQVRNYGAADGTIEGAYFDGSALRTPDGTMYFGGFNGVTAFAPAEIRENSVAPTVAITDFHIFNKPVRVGQGDGILSNAIEHTAALTLREQDSVFSLEFAALHYAAPQRNRYAYQLQGFDKDWVVTDSAKRFATYTNLDPGHYVFRVKAANKDGVWTDHAATLDITILPPYWKTWWFRGSVAALLLGSAWAVYRVRMRQLRSQKAQLEYQVGLRTTEVELKNQLLQQQKTELERRRVEAEAQRAEAEQRRMDAERQKHEVESQKEAVEQAHRNISVLSEIGREMSATLDIEKAMRTLYRHVRHLMDTDMFGVGFYREEAGLLEFPFSMERGLRSLPYSRRVDDPDQLAVWCLFHRHDIFINDFYNEYSRYMGPGGLEKLRPALLADGTEAEYAQSMLYTPLIVNDRVVGILSVQSRAKNAYRQVHLDMLQTLAAHAAVSLDNAMAYQRLEETLRELRDTQDQLMQQQAQVRLHTEELAQANRALQDNDERLRYAKQKAEDATQQKSEFLANMSHEMRTPLAGVIGMQGFALRDATLQDATREQIERAQVNAQALLSIINDLLDFSKIEAGKLTIENIDFALAGMVENVASLFEEQAAAYSVGFSVDFGDGLPTFVVGDPTRLRQVLVNLVGNAFKFTQRGEVRLRVEQLPRDAAAEEEGRNLIRFTVEDTGIGIPADAMPRLFQKFEQADSTTTRRYGGTGLGLAICRQLVELMGGEIRVASTPGVGSVFTFELPLRDGVAPPVVVHVPREPHSHQLKVLCAEDFPTNQIIIRMMLEDLGHKVDIAANGLLAVAACARTRYDLILMDGRMPEMDGPSATSLIRAGGPEGAPVRDQELMIIALTANASEEDRSRYLASGMDDFLTKPIDEAALHYQLSRAIERQLQRGIKLPRMAPREQARPSLDDLDAMFGVQAAAAGGAPTLPPVMQSRPAPRGQEDDPLKARLRAAFLADLPARLAELEEALAARDGDAAGRLFHGMKGSAAYLDEPEMRDLCGQLEQAADRADWHVIADQLPQLRAMLAGVAQVAQPD
ncbi:two-component regulator propeller domain-containing protein [Pseudoduganella namucuonensis]|uniref:two-component regulator propeller domain-containing protein n=1 Tax=Pseudoduganella namucuonensis TaxID=1035707 RepID=UPI001E4CF18B|nr:two-component regulator propeller domain-containing protein [Pseudoduganella namucuonensis]